MKISIETVIQSDLQTVWTAWTTPEDIKQWNHASEDWHTTESSVELVEGGKFSSRMEAKDGSIGFDFWGTYTKIIEHELIESELGDGRSLIVSFETTPFGVKVTETFDAENENEAEQQKQGWQSILNNFASYVENKT